MIENQKNTLSFPEFFARKILGESIAAYVWISLLFAMFAPRTLHPAPQETI